MQFRSIPRDAVATVDDEKRHRIRADVTPYNVVDSYKTRWIPGVWTRSLEQWKPPMAWAHRWEEPIGKLVDFDDDHNRLQTLHELDDFESVPRAKQAWSQLKSGTISNFSFGFDTIRQERAKDSEDVYDMLECDLDEVSPVLRGAVPGTGVAGFRSNDSGRLIAVARQLERGDMTLEEALATVIRAADLNSADQRGLHSHAKQDGSGMVQHSHAGDVGMHAHSGLMPTNARSQAARSDTTYDDLRQRICAALRDRLGVGAESDLWIQDLTDTWAVYQINYGGDLFKVDYSVDAGGILTLGEASKVNRKTIYEDDPGGRSDEDIAAARQLLNDVARR